MWPISDPESEGQRLVSSGNNQSENAATGTILTSSEDEFNQGKIYSPSSFLDMPYLFRFRPFYFPKCFKSSFGVTLHSDRKVFSCTSEILISQTTTSHRCIVSDNR
ncbi:hypothetical protein XENORESO_005725 [Xenotaenia resolanae]|uniref:Uncharacterized protein n=1 Tax=Xenotaenia resolanae TaxID=208358 RepID=A0ABV0X380_9TELE